MATPVIVPSMTTVLRKSQIRSKGTLVYDTDERQLYVSDGAIPGGVKVVSTGGGSVFPEPPVFDEAEVLENTTTTYGVLYRQSGGVGNDGVYVRTGTEFTKSYVRFFMGAKNIDKMVSITLAADDLGPTLAIQVAPKSSNESYPLGTNTLVDAFESMSIIPSSLQGEGFLISDSSVGFFSTAPSNQRAISNANYIALTGGAKDIADALIAYGLLTVV